MTVNEVLPIPVILADLAPDMSRRFPTLPIPRERVIITNTYPMVLGANPVQVLAHAPKRCHAHIMVNGSGIVAFGSSQSDVQEALSAAAGEYIGSVAYVNAAEFNASVALDGTSELWAGLISAIDPNLSVVTPSFPATGIAVQNPSSAPQTVVISPNGATITNVSINGITVGTGAGTYTIPGYGAISIAYSVATPTWVWSNATFAIPTTVAVFKVNSN
jgi:hypothetical protein